MQKVQRYDMLRQEWVERQLVTSYRDPEWAQLKLLGPVKMLEIARQPHFYGEMAFIAANILFHEYPESREAHELLWTLRTEIGPSAWIQSAYHPSLHPVLERIAFESTDATAAAIESAIVALILGCANFTPYVANLVRYLDSEDSALRLAAGAALASLGHRKGEAILASHIAQSEDRRSALYFVGHIYVSGILSSRKAFPVVIERAFQDCMEQIISCIKSSEECVSNRPLYSPREKFDIHFIDNLLETLLAKHVKKHVEQKVRQLLVSLYESGRKRYLGLLVVLRAFLTDQPYKSLDGQLLKCMYKPHPSSRRLLPLVEEMIRELEKG